VHDLDSLRRSLGTLLDELGRTDTLCIGLLVNGATIAIGGYVWFRFGTGFAGIAGLLVALLAALSIAQYLLERRGDQ